jgi:hypothetical protein
MGTRAGLDGCRIFRPHRNSIPRLRRSSSEPLYQPHYPSPHKSQLRLKITFTDRMIIRCVSIAVCKRRISVRHSVVTDYSYAVSCQTIQAVIRISPPLLIRLAPFKSVVDNTYAFTIQMEVFILYIQNSRFVCLFINLFISSYLHFMNPVNLCEHRRGRHVAWCDAVSFVTFPQYPWC